LQGDARMSRGSGEEVGECSVLRAERRSSIGFNRRFA
jgi:hypothetical protein